jgi:glycosyltransferase involved in cell wall biosynthesis
MFPERVELVTDYLPDADLRDLLYTGDIFLLPSTQVHSASLTDAFSYGMPVIASNGWGMSEYCFNGLNSLIGVRSESLPNISEYVDSMLPRLIALCGDRGLLAKMSENTLAWYNSNHSRENHKANLHRLVNLAMSRHGK